MRVYIIGSVTKSEAAIKSAAEHFEKTGNDVRYVKKEDENHFQLIHDCFLHIESWADIVVAVPKAVIPVLDIGDGTKYEMEHAKSFGKPVLIYYNI